MANKSVELAIQALVEHLNPYLSEGSRAGLVSYLHQEKPSLEDGKILCTILQPSQGLRERLLHFIETSENEACEKARDIFDLLFLDEIIEIVEIKFCAAGLAGNKNIDELRLILEKLMAGEMPARLVGKHKIQVSDKMIQALKVPLWNFCMTRILNPTPAHIAVMNLSRDFLITFFGLSEIKKLYQGELAKIENLHKEELAKLQAQYENPIVEIQMPYEEALKKLNIKFVKLKEQYESSSAKWYLFLGMSDLLYRYTHATTQSRNISITQASDALGFSVFGKNIHSEETKEHFQTSAEVEKEQGEMLGELEKAFRLDYMMFYLKTQITSKNPTFEKWLDDSINRMLDKRNLLVALEKRNFSISPVELVSALNAHGDAEFKSRYAKCNAADLNFKNDMEVKLILFYWVLDLVSGAQKENNALIMGLDFFTRMVNLYLSENRMARAEVLFLNLSSLFKLVGSNLLSSDSNIFRSALDDINSLIEAKKEKLIGAQSLAMKKIDLLLNQEKLNEALVALFNLRYNLNFSVTDPNHKEYQDRADGLMRLMLDDLLKANKVTEALQILVNGHEFNFEDTTIKCMPSHALMVSYRKEIKCSNFEDKILLGQLTKNIGDGGEAKNYFLGLLKDELSRGEFSNAIKVIRNARLIKGFSVSDHQRFDKLFFLAYINSSCSRVKAKKTDPIEINQYIDMILKIRTTGVLMFEGVRLVIRRKKGQADDESPWELVEAIVHLKNALLEANPIYYLEKTEIEVGKKSVPEKILTYSAALNQFLNRKNLQKNDYVHAVNFLNKMAGLLQDFKNSPKAKSSVIAHLGNSLNHMSSRVVVSYIEFLLKDSTSNKYELLDILVTESVKFGTQVFALNSIDYKKSGLKDAVQNKEFSMNDFVLYIEEIGKKPDASFFQKAFCLFAFLKDETGFSRKLEDLLFEKYLTRLSKEGDLLKIFDGFQVKIPYLNGEIQLEASIAVKEKLIEGYFSQPAVLKKILMDKMLSDRFYSLFVQTQGGAKEVTLEERLLTYFSKKANEAFEMSPPDENYISKMLEFLRERLPASYQERVDLIFGYRSKIIIHSIDDPFENERQQKLHEISDLKLKKKYSKLLEIFWDSKLFEIFWERKLELSDRFDLGLFLIDILRTGEFQKKQLPREGFFKNNASPLKQALAISEELLKMEKTQDMKKTGVVHENWNPLNWMMFQLFAQQYLEKIKESKNPSDDMKTHRKEYLHRIINFGQNLFTDLMKANESLPLEAWVKNFPWEALTEYTNALSFHLSQLHGLGESNNLIKSQVGSFNKSIIAPVAKKVEEFVGSDDTSAQDKPFLREIHRFSTVLRSFEESTSVKYSMQNVKKK